MAPAGRRPHEVSFLRKLFAPHFPGILGGYFSRFGLLSGIAGFVAGGVFTIIQKSNGGKRLPKAGLTTSLALTAMGLLLVFEVGKLRPMRPFRCDLAPGEHTLHIRLDSTGSPVHELLIQAGQETRCQVHYPPGGPRMIPEGWLALTQDGGDH